MTARMIPIQFLALLLALCLLPMAVLAGVADSSALAYEKAVQMLTTSSLTDGEKLEDIRAQFEQAGSYQFGVDYLTLTDALMILQAGNANRFDDALDSVRRLSRNDKFARHYSSHVDRSGQPVLPDLETLAQYIMARKLEAYQDLAGAVMLYDQYPVLDAAYRAGLLTSSIKLGQYEKAAALLLEGTLESVQQAAVIFEELGDFRDSPQRLQECRGRLVELTPTPVAANTLTNDSDALAAEAEAAEVKITELEQQIKAAQDQILSVSEQRDALAVEAEATKGKVTELEKQLKAAQDERLALVGERDSLSEESDASKRMVAELETLLKEAQDQIAGLTGERDALTAEANNAKGKVSDLEIKLKAAQDEALAAEQTVLLKVGDTITFGHYEQDNNISNGKEEIAWRVLKVDGDRVLLISKNSLDRQDYNRPNNPVTWATCTLRAWLNDTFLNAAFTLAEQKAILTTVIKNEDNPKYGTDGGGDTQDKVFLLSIAEAEALFRSDFDRFAYHNGFAFQWWLRSPGVYENFAAYVNDDGSIHRYGSDVDGGNLPVRPALWFNLTSP